jgi:hypothetical protein
LLQGEDEDFTHYIQALVAAEKERRAGDRPAA